MSNRVTATSGGCRPTRFNESGLFLEEPTISPDGRWIYYNKGGGGASIGMLTLGREGEDSWNVRTAKRMVR